MEAIFAASFMSVFLLASLPASALLLTVSTARCLINGEITNAVEEVAYAGQAGCIHEVV